MERCLHGPFLLEYPYDIAAEADEPALREQIIDKALRPVRLLPRRLSAPSRASQNSMQCGR